MNKSGAKMQKALEKTSLEKTSLEKTSLEKTSLEKTSLEKTSLEKTSLEETSLEETSLKLVIGKRMGFYAPRAKELLAQCLFGPDVVSDAEQRVTAKLSIPIVQIETISGEILGWFLEDGTLKNELNNVVWKKGYLPSWYFNLYGLTADGKYYLLPYNVPITELPKKVTFVAVDTMWESKEHMLAEMKYDGSSLLDVSTQLRADREVVLAAMNMNGRELKYAAPGLQADYGIVLAAIKQNPDAFDYAFELHGDPVVIAAYRDGIAARAASDAGK
jgi:hypothetical protein